MARGAGKPPAKSRGGSGGNDKAIYHLAEPITTSNGPQLKMIKALKLRPGTKNQPILTLDDFKDLEEDGYSINIHMFNLRGTKDNIVVCPKTEADPRPCPVCEVLNKDPSWYICLSGIDRNKYTFERKDKVTGQMGEITYTDLRRLILVTQSWTQRMTMNVDRPGTWRGANWEVSRSEPVKIMQGGTERTSYKDSPRIGDVWYFTEKFDEEKLKAELEKRAAAYGLPVEQFVQPFNYEVLLKPKTHQELLHIANDIKSDGSAVKEPEAGAAAPAAAAPATGGSAPETEIAY